MLRIGAIRSKPAGGLVGVDQREVGVVDAMLGHHEMHVLIGEQFRQIVARDESAAPIPVGVAAGGVVLRVVEFHIRLSGRYEHVSHIHFRQAEHGLAVVCDGETVWFEPALQRFHRASERPAVPDGHGCGDGRLALRERCGQFGLVDGIAAGVIVCSGGGALDDQWPATLKDHVFGIV